MPRLLGFRLSGVITVCQIVSLPSKVTFHKSSLPNTSQIHVLGIRGGIYADANITQYCTFTKKIGKYSISVSSSGLITASSSAKVGDSATIDVVYYYPTCGIVADVVEVIVEE